MNDSDSSGNIPHKLGFEKRSVKPEEQERLGEFCHNLLIFIFFFSWDTK